MSRLQKDLLEASSIINEYCGQSNLVDSLWGLVWRLTTAMNPAAPPLSHDHLVFRACSRNLLPTLMLSSVYSESLSLQRPDVLHRRLRRRPGRLQQVRRRRRGQSQHSRVRGARGRRPRRLPRRHERAQELSQVGKLHSARMHFLFGCATA